MKSDNDAYDHPSKKLPSRKSIPPFEALRAFDAVARLGGIRKAAEALLRDHAVVSRHLRSVEDWTGCTLLERTPAGTVLTENGRLYHEKISSAIDLIAGATTDIMRKNKENSLHIWCMPGLALHWLIGDLHHFEEANREFDIELRSSHEEPDFTRHEADVDIRLLPIDQNYVFPAELKVQAIYQPRMLVVASPDYLAKHPPITSANDVADHKLLYQESLDGWRRWFSAAKVEIGESLQGSRLWDGHMALAAALRGRGIALTNDLLVNDYLATGELVEVGKDNADFAVGPLWQYFLIARADNWDSKPISYFREWLITQMHNSVSTNAQ